MENNPTGLAWRPIVGAIALYLAILDLIVCFIIPLLDKGLEAISSQSLWGNGLLVYFFTSFGFKLLRNETLKPDSTNSSAGVGRLP